MNLLGIKFKVL